MKPGSSKPLSEKLKKYIVSESGCWLWTGAKDKDGYGVIRGVIRGVIWTDKAHRLSYSFHVGPIPKGKHILHGCDTPGCINPEHLYPGDPLRNGLDKKLRKRARGKARFGAENPMFGKTGELNPFYGKHHTQESIDKMVESKIRKFAETDPWYRKK